MNKANQLFESFPKPGRPDWNKAASAEINGASPQETLQWKTEDEQTFEPYYTAEDTRDLSYLQQFQLNGISVDARTWLNMPEVPVTDERAANAAALHHLHQEAEGVVFNTDHRNINFGQLLNEIAWEHCAVSFLADTHFPLTDLINYISEKNYSYGSVQGAVYWKENVVLPPALPSLNGFRFAGIVIPEETPVSQIADALTKGVHTIEAFLAEGYRINEVIKHIAFNVPVGPQLLVEIGKLKALRLLWYQVAQAYGMKEYAPADLAIHARSDRWVRESFQPHGNLLKGTVAAMAALSGGANALTVQPEDPTHNMMNRIARNVSVILREESHFGKVSDPFAGSYSVEIMTDRMARDAWEAFRSRQ